MLPDILKKVPIIVVHQISKILLIYVLWLSVK